MYWWFLELIEVTCISCYLLGNSYLNGLKVYQPQVVFTNTFCMLCISCVQVNIQRGHWFYGNKHGCVPDSGLMLIQIPEHCVAASFCYGPNNLLSRDFSEYVMILCKLIAKRNFTTLKKKLQKIKNTSSNLTIQNTSFKHNNALCRKWYTSMARVNVENVKKSEKYVPLGSRNYACNKCI